MYSPRLVIRLSLTALSLLAATSAFPQAGDPATKGYTFSRPNAWLDCWGPNGINTVVVDRPLTTQGVPARVKVTYDQGSGEPGDPLNGVAKRVEISARCSATSGITGLIQCRQHARGLPLSPETIPLESTTTEHTKIFWPGAVEREITVDFRLQESPESPPRIIQFKSHECQQNGAL